jgi:hypothetical protein
LYQFSVLKNHRIKRSIRAVIPAEAGIQVLFFLDSRFHGNDGINQTAKEPFLKNLNFDDLVKSPKMPFSVIPAKAGIQLFQDVLDPGFRRGDASREFLRDHQLFPSFIF